MKNKIGCRDKVGAVIIGLSKALKYVKIKKRY